MKLGLTATLIGAALLLSSAASAATLQLLTGTASVKVRGGFQPVVAPVKVEPGETIMVSPSGSARIVYAEGCWIEIEPAAILVVPEAPNCEVAGGAQRLLGVTESEDEVDDRGGWWRRLEHEDVVPKLGNLIIGGTLVGYIWSSGDDNNKIITNTSKPASP